MSRLVILGGGIVGLIASYLYPDSVVVEAEPNALNSRASLYSVMPPLCGELKDLCKSSGEELIKVAEELGVRYFRKLIIRKSSKSLGGKTVEGDELRSLEPKLTVDQAEVFEGGIFVEGDELISKLMSKAKMVKGYGRLVFEGPSVVGVKVGEELIKGEGFLLATGYISQETLRFANRQLGLKTLKGHLVVSMHVELKNIVILEDRIFVEGENLLLDGDATEATKRSLDFDAVSKTLEAFKRGFGIEPEVLEVRVGMRTVSADGKPVVERVAENAVLVTGYRFGFALAPYLAREGLRALL